MELTYTITDMSQVNPGKQWQWSIFLNGKKIDHSIGFRSVREAEINVKATMDYWRLNIVDEQVRKPFRGSLSFCSNFYPHYMPVNMNGHIVRATSESWYQAKKCVDLDDALAILGMEPAEAKRLGRKVQIRPDWDEVKVTIMRKILQVKFSDPELLCRLKATAPEELIEWNHWHDTFWGRCYCDRHQNTGQNWLGRLLIEIRDC